MSIFPPPGPELRSYYGSAAADVRGSANMAGIKNPAVDELIEKIVHAKDLESLKVASRALDRVLLWNHYVIPQFFSDSDRIAHWDKFGWPQRKPRYSVGFPTTWWIDADKAGGFSVDVNTASAADLAKLPGVDARIAKKIIEARPFNDSADVHKIISKDVFQQVGPLMVINGKALWTAYTRFIMDSFASSG